MTFARLAVSGLVLGLLAGCSPKAGWREAENLPVALSDGIEVARNDREHRTASLNLVCDTAGSLRLMLHARLVSLPDEWRWRYGVDRELRVLRDPDVVLFVDHWKLSTAANFVMGARLDEIIGDPLSDIQFNRLADAYGLQPPERVSVMIEEGGVFLRGTVSRAEIVAFARTCRPPQTSNDGLQAEAG